MKLVKDADKTSSKKPEVSDKQAEEAFKTILKWIGEDPNREGLVETPKRVIKAFKEYFKGYHQDAESDLSKTLKRIAKYGRDGFYTGPVADLIVEEMKRGNGLISHEDLFSNFHCFGGNKWRENLK